MPLDAEKKLARAAITPTAVFGRTGRPYGGKGLRILRIDANGHRWYAPRLPTWVLRYDVAGTTCPVADKAVERHGVQRLPLCAAALREMLTVSREAPAVTHAPTIDDVFEATTLDGELTFAAVSVGWHDESDYAALPLAYLWRRYGADRLDWRRAQSGLLSAWLRVDSTAWTPLCVGLIAPCRTARTE